MDDSAWPSNGESQPPANNGPVEERAPVEEQPREEQPREDRREWNNGGERESDRAPRERRRSRSRSPGREGGHDNGRGGGRGRGGGGRDGERGQVIHNEGGNLHVSGLSHKVDTRELETAFAKCGRVKRASVMYDPHSRESRGFGFVEMETVEEAEAAIAALNATELQGKAMNVEKARRGRARTPTPGRYHGPPKRNDFERPYEPRQFDSRYRGGEGGRGGESGGSRYDRGGGGGGGYDRGQREERPRYDDRRESRYDDRREREPRADDRRSGGERDDRGGRGGYEERPRY